MTKMWALVERKTNHIILTDHAYWAIINRYNCGTAANFYRQHPHLRIKRCTVTIP